MKNCPDCRHQLSCRFNQQGVQYHCVCHDLADDAPELWKALAEIVAEAMGGDVSESQTRKSIKLLDKHNSPTIDKLVQ